MTIFLAIVTRTRRAGVSCDTCSATSSAYSVVLVKHHRDFGTHDFKERYRNAKKSAETDGRKRVLKQFGDMFGGFVHNREAVLASLRQEVKKGRFFSPGSRVFGNSDRIDCVAAATVKIKTPEVQRCRRSPRCNCM